ncbi:hypothetical protein Tco_0619897 [Tanacetum coccineum]
MMSDHITVFRPPPNDKRCLLKMSLQASFLKDKKASDYDNSDPVPPRQNVVPSAEKTDSSQQGTSDPPVPTVFLSFSIVTALEILKHNMDNLSIGHSWTDTSRPDLVQAVCFCAREHQDLLKSTARRRDHADACTRKSTSGVIQFLGDKPCKLGCQRNKLARQCLHQAESRGVICKFAQVYVERHKLQDMASTTTKYQLYCDSPPSQP